MKVRSKLLASILSLLMVVFCLVGLSACSCDGGNNDVCAHVWGKWTVTTEATCTEAGAQERVCTECGEKETSEVSALGHTWNKATCSTPKTCAVCSATEGDVADHVYDQDVVMNAALKVAATCTNPAVYYKSCVCGEISTSAAEVFKAGEALAHTYNKEFALEGALKSEATCTSAAVYYKSCVCGAIGKDESATFTYGTFLAHNYNIQDAKNAALMSAATCTNAAMYYKSCACGAISKSPADAFTSGAFLSHTYDKEVVTGDAFMSAATCTNAAKYYKSCDCGAISKNANDAFAVGSPSAHVYKEVSSTPAACSTAATATYRCDCGDGYEETVGDVLGHLFSNVMPVEGEENQTVYERKISDCEYVVVYVCQRTGCGEHVEGEHVFKHSYVSSITKEATCQVEGEKTSVCQNCGEMKTTVIAPDTQNGHTWSVGTAVNGIRTDNCVYCPATKSVTVYDGGAINTNSLKNTEVDLGNASFNLDSGVVDTIGNKDVTLGAEKIEGTDRENLGLSEEELAQLGNNPVYNFTITDTEGTPVSQFGENNYITVTVPYKLEGDDVDSIAIWFINDNGELEAIEATYSNGYVTFKTNHFSYYTVTRLTPQERCALYGHSHVYQHVGGGCLKDEYDLYVCVRCHDKQIENYVTADGHDYVTKTVDATCTADGYVLNTCKDCGHSYRTKIAMFGHDWTEISHVDATCAENGYTTYQCTRCQDEYVITLAKSAHVYTQTTVEPKCDKDGYTLYDCDNCDYSYMDNYVAALGHSYVANWNWMKDYSGATLSLVCEANGSHRVILQATVGVSVVNGICSNFVRTTYTATASYNGIVYTDKQVKEEGSVDHAFSSVWSNDENEHWHECVCGAISSLGAHDFSNIEVTKAATCGKAGEGTATCVCGESKTVVIPATGNHNFENDVCTECGLGFVDAYYVTLMNSWKNIEGFAIKLQDFSFEVRESDRNSNGNVIDTLKTVGKVTQIDVTELALYIEDGELGGAARGSFVIYNGPFTNADAVCDFKAVIYDEYIYIDAQYGKGVADQKVQIKMSVNAAIEELLDETGMDMGGSTSSVANFLLEVGLPMLDNFVQANATEIDSVLGSVFNMMFTFEKQNDGSYVASLDYDKIYALNEALATQSVAEVVDLYFGAGAFDGVVDFAEDVLDLELSQIPEFLDKIGFNSTELINQINVFAQEMGAGADYDISAMLNSEAYKGVTIGMLAFQTEDKADYEVMVDEVVTMLRENSVYALIIEDVEYLQDYVDEVIDMFADSLSVSFATNEDGTLTAINFGADNFVYTDDGYYTTEVSVSGQVEILINSKINVSWSDIVKEMEAEFVLPTQEIMQEYASAYYYSYTQSGSVQYKGQQYSYDYARAFEGYVTNFDKLTGILSMPSCGDWLEYEVAYANDCFDYAMPIIVVDGQEIQLLLNNLTGKAVQIIQTETGYTAIYEDGSTKDVVVSQDDLSGDRGTVARTFHYLLDAAFGEEAFTADGFGTYVDYYYNPTTGELSMYSPHAYAHEYILEGEVCDEGVTRITTCKNCDYYEERHMSGCSTEYVTIDLSQYSTCGGFVEGNLCSRCGRMYIYNNSPKCHETNVSTEEIKDENGHVLGERRISVCENCGLTFIRENYKSEVGVCEYYEYATYYIYSGEECIVKQVYCNYRSAHKYVHDYTLEGETCEQGVTVITTCENCDYYNENRYSGHVNLELFNLSNHSDCGHYGYVQACPCGKVDNVYVETYGFSYDDATGMYVCYNCDLSVKYNNNQEENGCSKTVVTEFVVYKADEQIFNYQKEKVLAYHSFAVVSASSTGDGAQVIVSCDKCGEQKPMDIYGGSQEVNCNHNHRRFTQLVDGATSCEDGAISGDYCVYCGFSDYFNVDYEHVVSYREINLQQYGACYGYYEYRACACGEVGDGYYLWNSCGYTTSNEYYDEEGRLVYVQSCHCDNCGLRYDKSYYSVTDYANCTKTTYYSVVLSIGANYILDMQYSSTSTVHDYQITSEFLTENKNCEYGVIITHTCKTCGDNYTDNYYYHYTFEQERINLADYGSVCGGYASIYACACGREASMNLEHVLCDRDSKYIDLWIEDAITNGQYNIENVTSMSYYGYDAWMYTCAVTDPVACAYRIRYAYYYLKDEDGCYATQYYTWQFGYDEATDTYQYEKTFKTGNRRVYHNYAENNTGNTCKYTCVDCGSTYERTNYYDANGNRVKEEIIINNTLNDSNNRYLKRVAEYAEYDGSFDTSRVRTEYIDCNDNESWTEYLYTRQAYTGELNLPFEVTTYEYTEEYTSSDGGYRYYAYAEFYYQGYSFRVYEEQKYSDYNWYRYDSTYDFSECCMRTTTYTNSDGRYETRTECCCRMHYSDTIKAPTCSQEGLRGEACAVCGKEGDVYTISPNDHNWVQVTDKWYFCYTCGLENKNGASGSIIMEDLTDAYGNGENYVVGYYAQNNVEFSYYVSLFFENAPEQEIIVEGVEFFEVDGLRAVAFSKAYVETWAAEKGYTDYEVRFAFVPVGGDSSFDYAITFAERKSVGTEITGTISFVDYVAEGEYKSYTITVTEDSVWTFTSRADKDTYAYLYDANGGCLVSDDDNGMNGNFRIEYYLEVGKTYTLTVRWYSNANSGNMPIIIVCEPIA